MRDTSGPAFPHPGGVWQSPYSHTPQYHPEKPGISIRDYFAAQALAGMDHETRKTLHQAAVSEGIDMTEAIAISCYEIADAMLKERNK